MERIVGDRERGSAGTGDNLFFEILGPVRVWDDGVELPLGTRQQRLTLLLLLLNEGRPISSDALADVLWGDEVPRTAGGTIRTYIYRLRHLFARHGAPELITSTGAGYALRLDPERIDSGRFMIAVEAAQAARAEGDLLTAAEQLRSALKLWQGTPMADVYGSGHIDRQRTRLIQRRIAALEELFGLQLELGQHREMLDELSAAVAAEPMRERLREYLILALYRSGRQAEALLAYEEFRQLLSEELGADPGPDLRRLHHRILRADPTLQWRHNDAAVLRVEHPKPEQLPAPLPIFAGRRLELETLHGVTAPVVAIRGMPGIGKTALALRWAHDIAERYPDGQLHVDLAAFDPAGEIVSPEAALRSFLSALGVPENRIPQGLQAQSGLFRSLLAGRRMMVVLDNARDSEHVRPLLPGHRDCLVIITSRDDLSGLVTSAGAHPISVGPMPDDEAEELLASRLGAARLAAEPAAVNSIITECAGLPLALAAVASRAACRPGFSLGAIAAELRMAHGTLVAFAGTDSATDLRALFSSSFQTLDPEAKRLLQLLAAYPGEITLGAAAALAGMSVPAVQMRLAELSSAHLITERVPGRFTVHPLVRAYTAERSCTNFHEVHREPRRIRRRPADALSA